MIQLSFRDCLYINDIIYQIFSIKDFDQMRMKVLSMIKAQIPCEIISFYLADPTGKHKTADGIGIGVEQSKLDAYPSEMEDKDYMNIFLETRSHSAVFRHTDLFSYNERRESPIWDILYAPDNVEMAMTTAFFHQEKFVGTIAMYRGASYGDFTDREMSIMEMLMDHLTLRISQQLELDKNEEKREKKKIDKVISEYSLTSREGEILKYIAKNYAISEICDALFISENTAKHHLYNIYRKVGVNNRTDLNKLIL